MPRLARLPDALLVEIAQNDGDWHALGPDAWVDVAHAQAIYADHSGSTAYVVVRLDSCQFRFAMVSETAAAQGVEKLAQIGAAG